uniref:Uncharacterized protein n=1 Tax=Bos indicus x Bos taurus TaxID=30522 RepID=A0A4W2EVQ6_BOBOX
MLGWGSGLRAMEGEVLSEDELLMKLRDSRCRFQRRMQQLIEKYNQPFEDGPVIQMSTLTYQTPQEYWSGLPCPPPGDLPDPGTEPTSPVSSALWADSLPLSHPGSPSALLLTILPTIESKSQTQFCCTLDRQTQISS